MSPVRALLDLVVPPVCPVCRAQPPRDPDPLCAACAGSLPRNSPPVCVRCGMAVPGAFNARLCCAACRRRPPAYRAARAPWQYLGPSRRLVRDFKYRHRWRIGRWLGRGMARCAQEAWPPGAYDVVVPVPTHWLRARLRGYDPARELAGTLSAALSVPCAPQAVRRIRWTPPQARLRGARRRRNVRGAFRADPAQVGGRRVLLVDDVLTTGATAGACAAALKAAGARSVLVLTAARTPRRQKNGDVSIFPAPARLGKIETSPISPFFPA